MARILEKTVESVESLLSPFSTSYGFQSLMQKCISTRTKREEEILINGCLHLVKTKLGEPSPNHRSVVNCLSFVVFADLLGYKAPYAHIHAVKLAGSSSVVFKKIGYLFCSYLLGSSHELMLLMVNTMVRDLAPQLSAAAVYDSSYNPFAVGAALSATCYLTPLDSVSTVLPLVLDKLGHPSPYVRGKAIAALQHLALQITGSRLFHSPEQLSSFLLGRPLTMVHKLISDPHPAVLAIGLQFIQLLVPQRTQQVELCGEVEDSGSTVKLKGEVDSAEACISMDNSIEDSIFQGLAPALVHIQNQILQGRMPDEYVFHSVPSPWLQISILRLFRLLRNDEIIKHGVQEIVMETFKLANRRVLIGWAIIIECVLTAIEIDLPESFYYEVVGVLGKLVIESGTGKDTIPKWLSSNLLHTSLSLLQSLGKKHVAVVESMMLSADIQDGLRGSLNHIDPSIRRLAVGLITSCGGLSSHDGNRWTTEKICLLLLEECSSKKTEVGGLSHIPMEQWKIECLERIVSLTSTPEIPKDDSNSWQLAVLLRSLPLAPARYMAILIRDRIQRLLLPPGGDWVDLGSGNVARCKVLKLLEKHCQSKCASTYLLELYVWVLSQFYHLIPDATSIQVLQQLIQLGQKVVFNNRKGHIAAIVDVIIAIIQAISHIIFKKLKIELTGEKWDTILVSVHSFLNDVGGLDGTPRLIDACNELIRMLPHAQGISEVFAKGSSLDISSMDFTLSFLDGYICEKLERKERVLEASSSVPYESFPIDYYNAELATNVRRQIALGLPLHCHPWQVSRCSDEAKEKESLDLSTSLSLTLLSQSSNVPSSHETSLPEEFLSLSLESQPKEADVGSREEVAWSESKQSVSRIWSSAGRANLNLSSTASLTRTTSMNDASFIDQNSQQAARSQQDLMSLLLQTGNSGIILNQTQNQPSSSDPLDRLMSDGFQLSDTIR